MKFKNNFVAVISFIVFSLSLYAQGHNFSFGNIKSVKNSNMPLPEVNKSLSSSTVSGVTSDILDFWEKLNDNVFEDICKEARIRLKENADFPEIDGVGSIGGAGVKFDRYFKRYPDKTLALIDEVELNLKAYYGREILDVPEINGLSVGISGHIEGKSVVVRPIKGIKYCKELDQLIDLRKVKTVLPIDKKRIRKMEVGEIWKLPIITRFSFYSGVGANPHPLLSVSVGADVTKTRTPSITLYRMDENTYRLRIRIERVSVKSLSFNAGTTYTIEPADLGFSEAENILEKLVQDILAKEINKYLAFKLNYSRSKSRSKKILLEFLIDRNNEEQMDALVEFLKGDLGIIARFIKLGLKFNEFDEDQNYQQGLSSLNQVVDQSSEHLNSKPSYAGANHSHSNSSSFNINIPIIYRYGRNSNHTYNRYQSIDGKEVMHVHQAGVSKEDSGLNLPFVGSISKYSESQSIYVVNKEYEKMVKDPAVLYEYNAGFVKRDENSARNMLKKANDILKYVGTKGEGITDEYLIDTESIFPKTPGVDDYDPFEGNVDLKTYKRGMIAFKLLISEEGLKQILFAPAKLILKAYLNVMKEFDKFIIEKFGSLFKVNDEGKVVYDYSKAREIARRESFDFENEDDMLLTVNYLAYQATNLIKDVFSVRDEKDLRKRSEKFAEIASGKGKSKLAFDKFMKVVVQLVSKENMAGKIYISTDKKVKGEEDVNVNYAIDPNGQLNNTINEITTQRERFSQPSILRD